MMLVPVLELVLTPIHNWNCPLHAKYHWLVRARCSGCEGLVVLAQWQLDPGLRNYGSRPGPVESDQQNPTRWSSCAGSVVLVWFHKTSTTGPV